MSGSYVCFVELLDGTLDNIEFKYKKDEKGQRLMDHVCKELKLEEKDYFGLRYLNKDKQRCWVDLTKPLYKQFKGVSAPRIIKFRVKFYPISATKLKEEISRYQLFLQLKRDLKKGRLHCSFEEAARLGSYIIQASLGDYNELEHEDGYASEFDLFPTLSDKLRKRVEELHSTTMRGESASDAEGDFIEEASHLMTYGIDPFQVTDLGKTQLILGFSFRGVLLLRNGAVLDSTEWELVKKISHDSKNLHITGISGQATKVKRSFHFSSSAEAEHAGRCALEQQAFFSNNPQLTLRRSGSFILKRNSFRFKGTTLKDAQEKSQSIKRDEPSVNRLKPQVKSRRSRSLNDDADVSGCTPVMEENPPSPLKLYEKDAEGKLMPPSLDSEDPVTAAPDQMEKEQTDAEILHVMEEIRPADEMTDFGRIEELEQFAKVQEVQEDEQPPPLEEIIQAEVSNHVESIPVRREDESISNVPPPQSVSRGKENNHVSHTEKEKEAEQKGSGILAKALLTLALLVCAIVIFIVVLFETKVDFLDPVRKAHQVKMVESLYYRPSRDYAIHQANHLYSDVLQPSAKYVHSQWHKIVTKKAASPK
ncbi:FERM domain-containing protein 5-like [Apostichopus japonicus]|uniref:FERM domain-containing protein 5-like n=1 Tax=Stichopus japonicus TaxID=307972 RepID=UPI003AB179FE